MPGRPMKGFLSLPNEIVGDDGAVAAWVSRAEAHAQTLPPEKAHEEALLAGSTARHDRERQSVC